MKKNNSSRRSFLKKSFVGTGIALSGALSADKILAKDNFINDSNLETENLSEGVFPFFKFVEDFNFGEFIPKDQGGKFVQMELIGSEKDEIIAKILKDGLVEKNLGSPPDWSIFEKTELEKSVWFNRFYYLPSLARLYYLNKNADHIKYMMDFLKVWIKDNPVEGPSKSRYNWFDMQVAWRSIHLSWCYYLAKDGLSNSDKKIIYDLQSNHAKLLMKDFGRKELTQFNHQSHGALALLYLGILFPSIPGSSELLKTGVKIINHHVTHAFYVDGGNVEQMFGYYPFMASVFRDAYLLFKSNNVGEPELIMPLLEKMYVYLHAIVQPDNTVPPINDSYEETISFIVPTLASVIGYDKLPAKQHSTVFDDSQIGVIRSDDSSKNSWYINANAANLIGSHAHAGRLAFNVWFNKKPILVDSGCCNYDNSLLVNWYRLSEAHNTVIIDGKSDHKTSQREVQWVGRRYTENKIEKLEVTGDYKFLRMISPGTDETNSGVKWTRDLILLDNFFLIHDLFETDEEHTYETIFRFAELKVEQLNLTKGLLIDTGEKLALIQVQEKAQPRISITHDYFGSHAKNFKTPTAKFLISKKGLVHSTYLLKPINNKAAIKDLDVSQVSDGSTCKITINGKTPVTLEINKDSVKYNRC